jgi:TolB-like protein
VTGLVRLKLYKGNIIVAGRKSPKSLYDPTIATTERDASAYNQGDATGFIRLNALRLKLRPLLRDLGSCEVKHGVRVAIVNLYGNEVGNPQLPKKFQALKEHCTRVRWAATAVALLAVVVIVAGVAMFSRTGVRSALAAPRKSIAVLPFENLSDDKQNAYFADGVQDEILTNLARVADLRVISRTSTMQYKASGHRNLRDIAQALGVSHVVEGSVQRSGGRVRVNAQLIDAKSDTQLWGQSYDRALADVFAIENDLAEEIVSQPNPSSRPRKKQPSSINQRLILLLMICTSKPRHSSRLLLLVVRLHSKA